MVCWQLVKTPPLPAAVSMGVDLMSFQGFEMGEIPPTLRVYSWMQKTISYGYSQDIEKLIDVAKARKEGWDIVKRPTGGGIVYHEAGEISYSVVAAIDDPALPKGLIPSYLKISEAIVHALKLLGIDAAIKEIRDSRSAIRNSLCFEQTEEYEIVSKGVKIVGSAQKRGKKALLQQGAIKLEQKVDVEVIARALEKGFEKTLEIKFHD